MRLGYDAKENRERANYCRFNEAEAHAPRILPQEKAIAGSVMSFNEAEAHAPRIQAHLLHHQTVRARFNEAEAHAPRIPDPRTRYSVPILCFNEAEAHAPRIHVYIDITSDLEVKLQ